MKLKDVATKYGLDRERLEMYAIRSGAKIKTTLSGPALEDGQDVDEFVAEYKEYEEKLVTKAREKAAEHEQKAKQDAEEAENEAIAAAEEAKRKAIEAEKKRNAMAAMLITSGFSFDGYTITKYSGYISGDDCISVDRGVTLFGFGGNNTGDQLMESLVKIRRNALRELKEAAYDLGCNAVIGVDFDYLTLDPQTHDLVGSGVSLQPYVFGVTANGNAVIIEKDGMQQ